MASLALMVQRELPVRHPEEPYRQGLCRFRREQKDLAH